MRVPQDAALYTASGLQAAACRNNKEWVHTVGRAVQSTCCATIFSRQGGSPLPTSGIGLARNRCTLRAASAAAKHRLTAMTVLRSVRTKMLTAFSHPRYLDFKSDRLVLPSVHTVSAYTWPLSSSFTAPNLAGARGTAIRLKLQQPRCGFAQHTRPPFRARISQDACPGFLSRRLS